MKLLKILGFVILLLVLVGLFLPTAYDIRREVTIQAPAARVHAWVGDLAKWPEWTPWQEHDPTTMVTLGPVTSGMGASQTWTSEGGDGELTITASSPSEGITYEMAFILDGERVPAKSVMRYAEHGGATTVTWTMQGDAADFMPPVVSGYMNLMMEGSINAEFDKGLAKLKQVVEAGG
jgi:uncharacterized protein YndB with AHSA1/START domain